MQLSGDSLSSDPRSSRNTMPYALGRQGAGGDLFAVDPIRRSAGAIVVCAALIALPLLVLHGDTQRAVGLPTSWIGLTGLILRIPIPSISLLEEGWQRSQRRIWPTIDQLELPPRAHNLLRRHGFVTITSVEEAPDAALILLSNMDARVLREIRRAISLWRYRRYRRYRRWQERGFRGAR